jgi:prepilin-type N-terminal cleavage/methylation domain-containing protein
MCRQSKRHGFTIIEVMIVLAIAGLIMLIIFLAVPALQVTARNTQRKHDAAAIAAALANYADTNGGAMPNDIGYSTTYTNVLYLGCGTTGSVLFASTIPNFGGGEGAPDDTTCNPTITNYETASLEYYNPAADWRVTGQHEIWITNLSYGSVSSVPITLSQNNGNTAINSDGVLIVINSGCNSNNTFLASSTIPGTAAVLYVLENSSNGFMQCLEAS